MNKIDKFFENFEVLSDIITQKIIKVNKDDDDFDLVNYAVYGILSFIFSAIILILVSLIGYFPYIILLIVITISLDSMSGVYHAKTHKGCLFYTQCMYLFCGLNIMFMHRFYLLYLMFSLLIAFFNLDCHYMENAPQHSYKKQKLFKRKYIARLIIICIINIILSWLIYFRVSNIDLVVLQKLSILLSVSIIVNKFSITQYSKKILDKLR